jgi:hypothetical protein
MESTPKPMRAVLPLGKGRVVAKDSRQFKIAIGGSTTITVQPAHMSMYDIRDGDLLTLYTEVLLAPPQG